MSNKQLGILGGGAVVIVALAFFLFMGPDGAEAPEVVDRSAESAQELSEAYAIAQEAAKNDTTTVKKGGISVNIPETMGQEVTTVVMKTTKGDITIELFNKQMPITAGNFLKLVNEGYYNGVKFHRVIPGFMVQGGDPLTKDESQKARWGTGGPGYTIKDEFGQGLSNVRGTLSMANAGPNTGGSQFFINVADNTFLDPKHPVFGRVVSGMEVVDAIVSVERDQNDRPLEAVVMQSVAVKQ